MAVSLIAYTQYMLRSQAASVRSSKHPPKPTSYLFVPARGPQVAVGNHEYGTDPGAPHTSRNDPSGVGEPYHPDWGNWGNESGGRAYTAYA